MATEKQIAANRLNALRSTGPRTALGKAICAQNARRHQILAAGTVLSSENAKRFIILVARFYKEYKPQTPTEQALVDIMTTARWRMQRMASLEVAAVDHQYEQLRDPAFEQLKVPVCASMSYRELTEKSRTLESLSRFEARLHRQFNQALERLQQLRKSRLQPAIQPLTGQPGF
jgi:hypothetical protein